jgi:hypothetical protein
MESPIKKFIDDKTFFPIEPTNKKRAELFVKRANTELYESLWPL